MNKQERIQQIRGEIARLNAMRNQEDVSAAPALSSKQQRIQQIKDEMAALQSQKESEFSHLKFTGEQVAKGFLPGADFMQMLERGVQAERANMGQEEFERTVGAPLGHPSELLKETQYPSTAGQRVWGHIARGAGAAAFPMPGVPLLSPAVIGATAAGSGLSGLLQEGGIPALPAEIAGMAGAALAPGVVASLGRKAFGKPNILNPREAEVAEFLREKVGQQEVPNVYERLSQYEPSPIGYEPTTAEIAQNPTIAQYHRAMQEVPGSGISERLGTGNRLLQEEAEKYLEGPGIMATQESIGKRLGELESNVERAKEGLGEVGDVTRAGQSIQEALEKELLRRKALRKQATEPLYQEIEQMTNEINPTHAQDFIKNKVVKGDLEKELNYVNKLIAPTKGKLTKEDINYRQMYDGIVRQNAHLGQDALGKILEGMPTPKTQYPTVAELSAARAAINARLKEYGREGKEARAKILKDARNALDKDLEGIPLKREADVLYREYSKPISEITGHPSLGKVVRKNPKMEGFQMTASIVPDQFLKKAAGSIDNARALVKQIGPNKEAMGNLRGEINRRALNEIINGETGRVSINAINKFKKDHPGVEAIYPDLFHSKLKNVQNAQMAANNFMKEAAKIQTALQKDALGNYVAKSHKNIAGDIFNKNSEDNVNSLLKVIGNDKEALEGLRQESINHFMESIKNEGIEGGYNKLSYPKIRNFLKQNHEAFNKLLTPPQQQLIGEVERALKGRQYAETGGIGQGSATASRTALREETQRRFAGAPERYFGKFPIHRNLEEYVSAVGQGTPFVKTFFKQATEHRASELTNILNKALVDPNLAKRMMSPDFKSQKDYNQFMENVRRQSIYFTTLQANKEASTEAEEY